MARTGVGPQLDGPVGRSVQVGRGQGRGPAAALFFCWPRASLGSYLRSSPGGWHPKPATHHSLGAGPAAPSSTRSTHGSSCRRRGHPLALGGCTEAQGPPQPHQWPFLLHHPRGWGGGQAGFTPGLSLGHQCLGAGLWADPALLSLHPRARAGLPHQMLALPLHATLSPLSL